MIIDIQFDSEIPIYLQLRNQIVMAIGRGELKIGEGLPTVRQMAEDIGVNNMTVNKAYTMLKNEGFISIDRRHGATVKPDTDRRSEYKEKLEDDLSLAITESALKGIGKDEFINICNGIYDKMKGLNQIPLCE